jgi:hypothetical protein
LIDVIIANENLYQVELSFGRPPRPVEAGRQIKSLPAGDSPASEGVRIHQGLRDVQIVASRIALSRVPDDKGTVMS